jgi:Ca2+-binding RTX toxin-like protein
VSSVAANTTPTSGIPVIPNPTVGPHQTNVLAGPLVIDGGAVTPPDLLQSVRLPTEQDAALTPLPAQTANPNRVATLNVFDDLNTTGQTGTLGDISSDQLATLQALYPDAPFATMPIADFGEIEGLGTSAAPQSFDLGTLTTPTTLSSDGGIVFGSLDIVDILLGTGNDTFTTTDTVQNVINLVQGGGGTNDLIAKGGGGYFSPLLLFGGTSQNGQYYNSTSTHLTGWAREFTYPTPSAYPATTLDASLDYNTVILYGGAGAASIYGGGGGDQIAGGSGDDNIYAGQGNDIIHANDGFNVDLTHSLPQDLNNGFPGLIVTNESSQSDFPSSDPLNPVSDFIYGGIGHDIVFMVHGQVDQFASAITGPTNVFDAYTVDPVSFGLSFFFGGYGASTIVFAGSGQQSIDVHHTNQANIVIKNGFVDFQEPDGWISHLAKIGSSSPGSGGNDTIQTGNGNDFIIAGTGFDKITGGDGNKIVLGDDGFVKWAGTLLVEIASQDPGVSQDSTFANTITLGNGNDVVIGGSGANHITVGTGNDIIGGANDELDFDAQGRYSTFESVFPAFGMNNTIVASGSGIIIGGDGNNAIFAGPGYAIAPHDGAGTYNPSTGRWTITSNYTEVQTPTGPVVVVTPPPTVAPIVTPPPVKPKPKPKPKPKKKPKKKSKKKKGKKGKSKKKKKKGKSKKKKPKKKPKKKSKKKKSKPKKHTSKSKG